jgi:hypothetical protein
VFAPSRGGEIVVERHLKGQTPLRVVEGSAA